MGRVLYISKLITLKCTLLRGTEEGTLGRLYRLEAPPSNNTFVSSVMVPSGSVVTAISGCMLREWGVLTQNQTILTALFGSVTTV